jgi:hypothetical protein
MVQLPITVGRLATFSYCLSQNDCFLVVQFMHLDVTHICIATTPSMWLLFSPSCLLLIVRHFKGYIVGHRPYIQWTSYWQYYNASGWSVAGGEDIQFPCSSCMLKTTKLHSRYSTFCLDNAMSPDLLQGISVSLPLWSPPYTRSRRWAFSLETFICD